MSAEGTRGEGSPRERHPARDVVREQAQVVHNYFLTESTTPSGDVKLPMLALIGQSPSASDAGTWIATWYKPANPGASAHPKTCADVLLIVTVTLLPVL